MKINFWLIIIFKLLLSHLKGGRGRGGTVNLGTRPATSTQPEKKYFFCCYSHNSCTKNSFFNCWLCCVTDLICLVKDYQKFNFFNTRRSWWNHCKKIKALVLFIFDHLSIETQTQRAEGEGGVEWEEKNWVFCELKASEQHSLLIVILLFFEDSDDW